MRQPHWIATKGLLDFLTSFPLYLFPLAEEFAVGRIPLGVPCDQAFAARSNKEGMGMMGWILRPWPLDSEVGVPLRTYVRSWFITDWQWNAWKSHWWAPRTASQCSRYY